MGSLDMCTNECEAFICNLYQSSNALVLVRVTRVDTTVTGFQFTIDVFMIWFFSTKLSDFFN